MTQWNRSHVAIALLVLLWPRRATAHASDQTFVLLLPTDVYMTAGVAVVALTVLALFAVPDAAVRRSFAPRRWSLPQAESLRTVTSLSATAVLWGLVWLGFVGPRDPLSNLMPLTAWTLVWIGLVTMTGVLGDLARWLNPWSGLHRVLGLEPVFRLPERWGVWPAVLLLLAFTAFLLADVAPEDPARLAWLVAIYWQVTMLGVIVCGPAWLRQVEFGCALSAAYARLAPLRRDGLGGPGWHVAVGGHVQSDPVGTTYTVHAAGSGSSSGFGTPVMAGAGGFALALLGAGSFDGLHETFWWFGWIGVNPLEFPGRSAVVWSTLIGLAASVLAIYTIFGAMVWLGFALAGMRTGWIPAAGRLALSLLPIAFAYHIAHYLTSFLVNIQYTVAALTDPLGRGADLLGIEPFRVTTGFFNRIDTVRTIWLTQAGAVVIGHVWSVLLAHRIAMDVVPGDGRKAALATLPLSLFMIAYTFLGLWLLAAPRGV